MLTLATLANGTIFRFANDPHNVVHEKIGPTHYRKGENRVGFVCLPNRCAGFLGENEPVIVLKAPVVTIPGR